MLLILKIVLDEIYYPTTKKEGSDSREVVDRCGLSFDPGVGDDLEGVPLGGFHVEMGDHVFAAAILFV